MNKPRRIKAPTGTKLSAKSWLTEAPLRMLMNNLDPEVAERPEDLVVYGGIGKAARKNMSVPIQIEDRHVLADFAPACLEQDFEQVTPSAYLTSVAPLQEAEQVVRAQSPNAAVRERLQMDDDEPSLVVIRRTWSKGRPVTFSRLHHPGSRYELAGHYVPPGTRKSTSVDVVQLETLKR